MGSPFQLSVDFVDHQAELYELPTKVCIQDLGGSDSKLSYAI